MLFSFVVIRRLNRNTEEIRNLIHAPELQLFDATDDDIIRLPTEPITLDTNPVKCHQQLTECTDPVDCTVCQEFLASCNLIEEDLDIELEDGTMHTLEAGKSYCLAMNIQHSRTCNPNTGRWLLVSTSKGFTLICSCRYPGIVSQLHMFSDCNISVGCNGVGSIQNMNANPLTCQCDLGFVSDVVGENNEPICRARTINDAIYDVDIFPRAPCPSGYVQINHPGLDPVYAQRFINPTICVRDPCSIDPITGRDVHGELLHEHVVEFDKDISYCNCHSLDRTYGISIDDSMVAISVDEETQRPLKLPNACISPSNEAPAGGSVSRFFWARQDVLKESDLELALVYGHNQIHNEYIPVLNFYLNGDQQLLKFALTEFYHNTRSEAYYTRFIARNIVTLQPWCFQHDRPGCTMDVCVWTDPRTFLIGMHEFFTGQRCYLSRTAESFHPDFRGIGIICSYASTGHYGNYFAINHLYNDVISGTLALLEGGTVRISQADNLTDNVNGVSEYLRTFPFYSRT